MGKFGSQRSTQNGISFASKLEAAVHQILLLREKAGEIRIEAIQDRVKICCEGTCAHASKIEYIPDFKCVDKTTGRFFWVEAKGFETPEWRIKRRLWMHYGPGRLEIWKGSYQRPKLFETIHRD